jgi:hypothetical protein
METVGGAAQAINVAREVIRDLWSLKERRQKEGIASNAASLAFWRDGMWAPLQRIAAGQGTKGDLDEIERNYRATHREVATITRRLRQTRQQLGRLPGGLEIGQKIEDLLLGPSMKWQIRRSLADLVEGKEFDTARAQNIAKETCTNIEQFNLGLAQLHRELLPPA